MPRLGLCKGVRQCCVTPILKTTSEWTFQLWARKRNSLVSTEPEESPAEDAASASFLGVLCSISWPSPVLHVGKTQPAPAPALAPSLASRGQQAASASTRKQLH